MANRMRTSTLSVVHDEDPRSVILKGSKEAAEKIHPTGNNLLLIVYERSRGTKKGDETKTKGGILIPQTAGVTSEDQHQGNVGLVVRVGPNVKDLGPKLGRVPKIGDWVMFRQQDSVALIVAPDWPARDIEGQMIRQFLDDCDIIT